MTHARGAFVVKLVDKKDEWRNIFVKVLGLPRDPCPKGRGTKFIQRLLQIRFRPYSIYSSLL